MQLCIWRKITTFGGAIYVLDTSHMSYCNSKSLINIATLTPKQDCYFQLPGQNLSSIHMQLFFKNNSADIAGNALYGGEIDNCKLMGLDSYNSGEVFDKLVDIDQQNFKHFFWNTSHMPMWKQPSRL